MSRDTFFEVSSRSRYPKVSLGLHLGLVCLESRSRHCSDIGKAHRSCKYVMIYSRNRIFLRFLFKLAIIIVKFNLGNLYQSFGVGRFDIRLRFLKFLGSGLRLQLLQFQRFQFRLRLRIPTPTY